LWNVKNPDLRKLEESHNFPSAKALKKVRLDLLLVQRGLVASREKAQRLILAGLVSINGSSNLKAGSQVDSSVSVEIKQLPRYVSRGGDKLESCHTLLGFDTTDLVFMDVGASTGGFTDFLLQQGAARVYAVDVGTNQLAYQLRENPQVFSLEQTHINELDPQEIPESIDGFLCDVSFISLSRVIPSFKRFSKKQHFVVVLAKPQFEVQKPQVGKGGVVRDQRSIHLGLKRVYDTLIEEGYGILGLEFSRIPGPKGNVEFFFYARSGSKSLLGDSNLMEKIKEKEVYYSS
jgi:23S rRNA (cytidine1920-2'-O)/16S rRNA (cytidine1409-2'-O)-methyltransferase